MTKTQENGLHAMDRRTFLKAGAGSAAAVAFGGVLAACGSTTATAEATVAPTAAPATAAPTAAPATAAPTTTAQATRKLVFAFPTFLAFSTPITVAARDACEQIGWDYSEFWDGSDYSAVNLVNSIQTAIQMKPDVILTGGWEKGVAAAAEEAQKAGIFVEMVNANNYPDDMNALGIVYVGPNEVNSAYAVSQKLMDMAVGKGKNSGVVLAGYPYPTSQTNINRVEGCKQGVAAYNAAKGTSFTAESFEDKAADDPTQSAALYTAQMTRLGDSLIGIAAVGGSISVPPCAQALKEAGLTGQIPVGTWDTDSVVMGAIEDGSVTFFKDQASYFQGYMAVHNAWGALERKQLPMAIGTEAGFVGKDQLASWQEAAKLIEELAKQA